LNQYRQKKQDSPTPNTPDGRYNAVTDGSMVVSFCTVFICAYMLIFCLYEQGQMYSATKRLESKVDTPTTGFLLGKNGIKGDALDSIKEALSKINGFSLDQSTRKSTKEWLGSLTIILQVCKTFNLYLKYSVSFFFIYIFKNAFFFLIIHRMLRNC
jgi:hypothetical protein